MSIEDLRQKMLNELGPAAQAGYPEAQMYFTELLTCPIDRVLAIASELNTQIFQELFTVFNSLASWLSSIGEFVTIIPWQSFDTNMRNFLYKEIINIEDDIEPLTIYDNENTILQLVMAISDYYFKPVWISKTEIGGIYFCWTSEYRNIVDNYFQDTVANIKGEIENASM